HGYFEVASGPDVYLCTLRGRLRKLRPQPPVHSARPSRSAPQVSSRFDRADRFDRSGRSGRSGRSARAVPAPPQDAADGEQPPTRIAAGDRVLFTPLGAGQGIIEEVLPRRTALSRARSETGTEQVMLANLDQAML